MFTDILRSLRKKNGDTQESLAQKINVPVRTYASWERSEREMPHDVLVSVADLYGVSIDYLLGREDPKEAFCMPYLAIGQRLVALRKEKKVNQDTVAEACNISRVSLARYENGTRMPVLDIASRLANYYGVTVDYILGRDEATVPTAMVVDTSTSTTQPQLGPETQGIIQGIIAKLLQMDDEGQKEAANYIDYIASKRNGGE